MEGAGSEKKGRVVPGVIIETMELVGDGRDGGGEDGAIKSAEEDCQTEREDDESQTEPGRTRVGGRGWSFLGEGAIVRLILIAGSVGRSLFETGRSGSFPWYGRHVWCVDKRQKLTNMNPECIGDVYILTAVKLS